MRDQDWLTERAHEYIKEGLRQRGHTPQDELEEELYLPMRLEHLAPSGYYVTLAKGANWQTHAKRWTAHFKSHDPANYHHLCFTYFVTSRTLLLQDIRYIYGGIKLVE